MSQLLVAGAALTFAACASADADEAATSETTAPASEAPATTSQPTTKAPATTSSAAAETSTAAEPDPAVRAGGIVSGKVELEMLEPVVTLTAENEWSVATAVDGAVILQDPEPRSQFTEAVLFLEAKPFGATIDDWANANEAASIESRDETQVGGLDSIVYDISYTGESELAILTAKCCGGSIVVRNTEHYRLWTINTDSDQPLVVFAAVRTDAIDWLDKAEELIATIEIAA